MVSHQVPRLPLQDAEQIARRRGSPGLIAKPPELLFEHGQSVLKPNLPCMKGRQVA